jgi:hypothetical protein
MKSPPSSTKIRRGASGMECEEDVKPAPRNRGTAESGESKLRRSPRNCPLCLASLGKIAPRTRLMKMCSECQAHPSPDKECSRCGSRSIWENKQAAACRQCGLHGAKSTVIAN